MKSDLSIIFRRAGSGMAAALFLAGLPGAFAAGNETGDALPPPCCGNGPPNVNLYGTGIEALPLQAAGPDIEFKNPFWGKSNTKNAYAWAFVPDATVVAFSYTDPNGLQQPVISYLDPKGFHGLVFLVAPGFTLDLRWLPGHQPDFSTRPLGSKE